MCPKCEAPLRGDVHTAYRTDVALQNLVYKLAPSLYWKQVKRRNRSLAKVGDDAEQLSERKREAARRLFRLSSQLCTPRERISIAVEYVPMGDILQSSDCRPSTSSKSSPSENANFRRYFRCEASKKLVELKMLLEAKLALSDDNYIIYFIDPKLRNQLDNEFTIQDIIYMFSWTRQGRSSFHLL